MLKYEFDKYFSVYYIELKTFADKIIKQLKLSSVLSEDVLAECYIYLLDLLNELIIDKDIIAYSKTFIKNQLYWNNSKIRRIYETKENQSTDFEGSGIEDQRIGDDSIEISTQVETLINNFLKTLTNYEKRLYHIYVELEIKKGKDVSSYLNIPISTAYTVINECKIIELKLKNYIIKNNIYE